MQFRLLWLFATFYGHSFSFSILYFICLTYKTFFKLLNYDCVLIAGCRGDIKETIKRLNSFFRDTLEHNIVYLTNLYKYLALVGG